MYSSRDLLPVIQKDLAAVKKDNDFIYNDRVPPANSLEPISKATVAKPIRLSGPGSNYIDLFANILPLEVNRAMTTYQDKRDALVTMEIQKLKEATQDLNAYVIPVT